MPKITMSFFFALALGPFAAMLFTAPVSAAEQGEALYAAQCADCHDASAVAAWAEARPDEAERRAWLEEVLQMHYPPAEDEVGPIIDHIESLIAED